MNEPISIALAELARPRLPEAVELFTSKRAALRNEHGAWHELIYCILAGTQVPVETARRAHRSILTELAREIEPCRLASTVGSAERIEVVLRAAGYRYPGIKSRAIVAASVWVVDCHGGDLRGALESRGVAELERELTRSVSGVGKKIANHWLRNVGLDTCTIDIHLKRLFCELGVLAPPADRPLTDGEFERCVSHVRALSMLLKVPIAEAQYALWLAVRGRLAIDGEERSLW